MKTTFKYVDGINIEVEILYKCEMHRIKSTINCSSIKLTVVTRKSKVTIFFSSKLLSVKCHEITLKSKQNYVPFVSYFDFLENRDITFPISLRTSTEIYIQRCIIGYYLQFLSCWYSVGNITPICDQSSIYEFHPNIKAYG